MSNNWKSLSEPFEKSGGVSGLPLLIFFNHGPLNKTALDHVRRAGLLRRGDTSLTAPWLESDFNRLRGILRDTWTTMNNFLQSRTPTETSVYRDNPTGTSTGITQMPCGSSVSASYSDYLGINRDDARQYNGNVCPTSLHAVCNIGNQADSLTRLSFANLERYPNRGVGVDAEL